MSASRRIRIMLYNAITAAAEIGGELTFTITQAGKLTANMMPEDLEFFSISEANPSTIKFNRAK